MGTYTYPKFPYSAPADLQADAPQRRPLIIVGAGPVGLAAAIDARLKGLPVLVFDDDDTVSIGSRAVCYAKRALEVLDRLGVGDPLCDKGVSWNVGRTFFREKEVYRFDLVPDAGHKRPGMINLQQYYLEEVMVARALELGADIRWRYKVVGVRNEPDHVSLRVDTPDGTFDIEADWLIVADGARSPIRNLLGLEIEGRIFMDRFLIADVIMKADFPAERWFWFDPPFHRNQSVLLHKQSDNVWRIDFQLGWDADPEEEKKPENVIPRLKAMLGDDRPFDLEWVSIYTFQCRRMKDFRAGRRAVRGRRGAPGVAVRRARRELGLPGHRRTDLEAAARDGRQGARRAAGHLQRRPHLRRRRKPDELHALDRLHHAEKPRQQGLSQCGARPGAGSRVRAPAGELRPPVGAGLPDEIGPEHARQRQLRRRHGARRADGRCPDPAGRPGRLAARPARQPVPAAGVCRQRGCGGCGDAGAVQVARRRCHRRGAGGRDAIGWRRSTVSPCWPTPRAWWPAATTRNPAPPTWSARTSMWPRAGAPLIPTRVRAAVARATCNA
jgi:2-polyprenyl-6-methoxyphenol hydroxylase-like FAD-dependent oxidoreductase